MLLFLLTILESLLSESNVRFLVPFDIFVFSCACVWPVQFA